MSPQNPFAKLDKIALESLLTRRGFGPTLTREAPAALGPRTTDHSPRSLARPGAITEFIPEPSSPAGVTSMALQVAATRGGACAWIDPRDRFDPASAARAGMDLDQLLWLRSASVPVALEATHLILQAGRFTLVVLDLLDAPNEELRQPRAVWFRLLRRLERERRASLLLLAPHPLSGTCADPVIAIGYEDVHWHGTLYPTLEGARVGARVVESRRTQPQDSAKHPPASVPHACREFVA